MNTKINYASGVINLIAAVALAVNTFIIMLCLFAFIIMPLLLPIWFLPFVMLIPLFGGLFAISLAATVCNLITGVGSVVASTGRGKLSCGFAIASVAVDVVFIPVNALFFAYGVFALTDAYAVNWLTVLIAVASSLAVVMTIASIVLNAINLSRHKVNT